MTEINPLDITYSSYHLAMFNTLETFLGIINTCMPVLRPVLRKILSSKALGWTQNGSTGSGSGSKWSREVNNSTNPRTKEPKNRQFVRMHEPYPLTDLSTTHTSIIHNGDLENNSPKDRNTDASGRIRITQQWQVDSRPT